MSWSHPTWGFQCFNWVFVRDYFINKPLQGSLLNTQYFVKSNGPLVLNLSHLSVFITTQHIHLHSGYPSKILTPTLPPPKKSPYTHDPFCGLLMENSLCPFRWTKMTSPRNVGCQGTASASTVGCQNHEVHRLRGPQITRWRWYTPEPNKKPTWKLAKITIIQ